MLLARRPCASINSPLPVHNQDTSKANEMETNLSEMSPAQVRTETLTAVPLSPAIGAEIVGLDLRTPLDNAQFGVVLDAWHRYCILLFRNQHLETEDQLRFAGRFGELSTVINNNSENLRPPSLSLRV